MSEFDLSKIKEFYSRISLNIGTQTTPAVLSSTSIPTASITFFTFDITASSLFYLTLTR